LPTSRSYLPAARVPATRARSPSSSSAPRSRRLRPRRSKTCISPAPAGGRRRGQRDQSIRRPSRRRILRLARTSPSERPQSRSDGIAIVWTVNLDRKDQADA
jgi:hypothetical protein